MVLGVRGFTDLELTVYGPARELHSGHYGNWAPNPALELARLLASMKDDAGRVTIDGFYRGHPPAVGDRAGRRWTGCRRSRTACWTGSGWPRPRCRAAGCWTG